MLFAELPECGKSRHPVEVEDVEDAAEGGFGAKDAFELSPIADCLQLVGGFQSSCQNGTSPGVGMQEEEGAHKELWRLPV
jgi:hypothetical protein